MHSVDKKLTEQYYGKKNQAIYFSRSAIPHVRDIEPNKWHYYHDYWGHAGIYCFRADILKNWFRLPKSKLEKVEKLEQLKLIDYGYTIDTFSIEKPTISIDNITQLEEVRKLINENNKKIEKTEKISTFLKSVYGEEIFNQKVDKLSKTEFNDLCENLQNGIAISTPVFDLSLIHI